MSEAKGPSIPTLRAELEARADPARAEKMEAYLKGHGRFLGVPAPERRQAAKAFMATGRGLDGAAVMTVARDLWAEPEREFNYVAADWLRRWVKALEPGAIDDVGRLITTDSWWDTVDPLASQVVGPMVAAHPELVAAMDAWIDDDNMWLARTAILHQLTYGETTDVDRLFAYCVRRADHPDFFIRKAIGWALRQLARTEPEKVAGFVADNHARLSPLSRREALKHL